jgi:hypothetical protein
MKKLLILPLLLLLTGCVTYYYPETAFEDGVYYAQDDPSYVVSSGAYAGMSHYPWASLDYFYLSYYPYYYPGHYSRWYFSNYYYPYYPVYRRYDGYCFGNLNCYENHYNRGRNSKGNRYAGNNRGRMSSASRSTKSASRGATSASRSTRSVARSTRSRSGSSSSTSRSSKATARRIHDQ